MLTTVIENVENGLCLVVFVAEVSAKAPELDDLTHWICPWMDGWMDVSFTLALTPALTVALTPALFEV